MTRTQKRNGNTGSAPDFEDFPRTAMDEAKEFREDFFQQARSEMGLLSPAELRAKAEEAEAERRKLAQTEVARLFIIEARLEEVWRDHATLTAAQMINVLSEMRKVAELRAELSGALPARIIQYE